VYAAYGADPESIMRDAGGKAYAATNKKIKPQLILCVKMRKETAGTEDSMLYSCALYVSMSVIALGHACVVQYDHVKYVCMYACMYAYIVLM
jgi:hypothetical protein